MDRNINYFRASRIVQMKKMMRDLSNLSTYPAYMNPSELENE